MPEISRFFGITIKIHWGDHNPPHFHAYYGEWEATFGIKSGSKTKGKLPKKAEKIVEEWAEQYYKELLECWDLISKKEPFEQIKGADK